MSGSNRVSLMVFFLILAPISIIAGLVFRDWANVDISILESESTLNWFQQNPEITSNLSLAVFIIGGIFAFISILLSLSMVKGGLGSDDEKMGEGLGRLR